MLAGRWRRGLYLAVVNGEPSAAVRSEVVLDGLHYPVRLTAALLDSPGPLALNTPGQPHLVKVSDTRMELTGHEFAWTFPAHSLSLLAITFVQRAARTRHTPS